MNELNVWESSNRYKDISIEDFLQKIKNGEIKDLYIGRKFTPGDQITNMLEKSNNKIINYTSDQHPITFPINPIFGYPSISIEYFKKYEKEIKEAFLYSYEHTSDKYYAIYDFTFSQELLDKLLEIENVTLSFYNVKLTPQQLKQIKDKHIDATLDRKQISSRYIFGYTTFMEAKTQKRFYLSKNDLEVCNIDDFIYFNPEAVFSLHEYNYANEEEYLEKTFTFMEKLDQLNKNFGFNIKIEKRSTLKKFLQKYHFKNVYINHITNDLYDYPYQEYMEEEKILDSLVEPILKANLSPMERFIAVYNIVKNFKPYKENSNDVNQSRFLRYILHNDFMVCVGYAKLLECLLERVGINANGIGVMTDVSYDEGFDQDKPEEKPVDLRGHARVIVSLDDDKYNIHGLFMSDPTWDNGLDKDYLNYSLMTMDNMTIDNRMFSFSIIDPLLSFHSFKEFVRQVNFILKRTIDVETQREERSNISYPKIVLDVYRIVCKGILHNIRCDIKNSYFQDLLKKCQTEQDYQDFLTELGHYLLERINQPISRDVLFKVNDNIRKRINNWDTTTAKMDTENRDLAKFPYEVPKDDEHMIIPRR